METGCKIITGVDRLLMMVNEKHEISLSQATRDLDVSRGILEHWTETLEEAGLIASRITLNDRILLSLEQDACTTGSLDTIKRNLKSLKNGSVPDIDAMQRLSKELNEKIKAVQLQKSETQKLKKRLEKVKEEKLKVKKQRQRLAEQKKRLSKKERFLNAEKERFKTAYVDLLHEREELKRKRTEHEQEHRQQLKELLIEREILGQRERKLNAQSAEARKRPQRETSFFSRLLADPQ